MQRMIQCTAEVAPRAAAGPEHDAVGRWEPRRSHRGDLYGAIAFAGSLTSSGLLRILLAACAAGVLACSDDPADGSSDVPDTSEATPDETSEVAPDVAPEVDTVPVEACTGTTEFAWDPDDDSALVVFPNDALTVDDATARTGLRVSIGEPRWLADQPQFFQGAWRQLDSLDGFGTSAGIVLRFSAPVSSAPEGLTLFDLSVTPAVSIPVEVQVLDAGATLVVWPLRPLREEALHGLVATSPDAADDCIKPSAALQSLLAGTPTSPTQTRLQPRYTKLVEAAAAHDITTSQIAAATVFTTQSFTAATLHQRAHLDAETYAWKQRPTCTESGDLVVCEGDFFANDYRIEGYLGDAFATDYAPTPYRLPVHLWMPKDRTGPLPLIVFGHGLGGSAMQAEDIAELGAAQGFATLAISAPRHGDHPTATSTDAQAVFTSFFGIDISTFSINGFVFRENLRQAAFDKLQVMKLIAANSDIDGDDAPDIDVGRVAYWGISLGGILGPNFVGMTDDVDAAILSVAGARLISVVAEAEDFSQLFEVLATVSGGADNLLRQAPAAQTLIDGADPVNWATHLITDQVGRTTAPHVLLQMVMGDTTVPNIATRSLARALDAPQVPTIITPISLLEVTGAAPVSANREGVTVGLFQFDRVTTTPGGNPRKATHGGVFSGLEAIDQVAKFLETWLVDDAPSISDPYSDNGTPPL